LVDVKVVTTEEEKQLAFHVRMQVFVEEQGVPRHLELDEFDNEAVHFIVKKDEEIIGAARLREISPGIGKIERVCILKQYRGHHLGASIMKFIEQYAINHKWERLKLYAQVYAIPFYEKLGYVVTSPEFLDAYIPHRVMEKDI